MRENMLFIKKEYKRRVRKTKEMMDRGGMKMLLVMDPAGCNGRGGGGAVAQSHRSYGYGQTVSRRIFLRTELCAGLG